MTKMKIRTSFPNQDIGIQCHTLCKHLLPSRKTGFHEVGFTNCVIYLFIPRTLLDRPYLLFKTNNQKSILASESEASERPK